MPLFLLLLLGTNWGLGFSLAKIGVTSGMPPLGYAFWQALGAGAVLLAVGGASVGLPPVSLAHLRYYLLAGAFGTAVPLVNMLVVVAHVPVGVVTVIVSIAPLLTYGFAQLCGLERVEPRRAFGIALGFAGALMILLPRASLPSPDMVPWALLSIVTPLFYAGSNVYIGYARPPGIHSLTLAGALQLAAAVCVLPPMLATGSFHPLWPPLGAGEWVVLGAMAMASIGSLLMFEIMRLAGTVYFSQVAYVVTIAGVLWGMYIFGERHSAWIWGAMGVIFCGLMLARRPAALNGSRG
ncbi:MAG: DMT family transporter [Pseudomonadota bacterium]